MTDIDINDAMKRAAEIYAQDRDVFDFGPPPFSHAVQVKQYTLRLSAHLPAKPAMDALAQLLNTVSTHDKPMEAMRWGLAYIQAVNELVGAQAAADERGDT